MKFPIRGRKTLREVMQDHQRSEDTLAAIWGKPRRELPIPAAPKTRIKRNPSPAEQREPSEADILKAVMSLLKRHPKVAQCWRQNSGTFQERNRDGSVRYIRANTQRGMSDIMGIMSDGRTLAVEVKSRVGRMRPGQEEFLQTIRSAGGVAGVCRSVDDAVRLLEGA